MSTFTFTTTPTATIAVSGTFATGGLNSADFSAQPVSGNTISLGSVVNQPDEPFSLPAVSVPAGSYTVQGINTAVITETVVVTA